MNLLSSTAAVVNVPQRRKALPFEVFESRYQPIEVSDGCILREWDDPLIRQVDQRYVWTVVDCNGALYLSPGFSTVNYMGRVVTRRGWSDVEFSNPGYRYD